MLARVEPAVFGRSEKIVAEERFYLVEWSKSLLVELKLRFWMKNRFA